MTKYYFCVNGKIEFTHLFETDEDALKHADRLKKIDGHNRKVYDEMGNLIIRVAIMNTDDPISYVAKCG